MAAQTQAKQAEEVTASYKEMVKKAKEEALQAQAENLPEPAAWASLKRGGLSERGYRNRETRLQNRATQQGSRATWVVVVSSYEGNPERACVS